MITLIVLAAWAVIIIFCTSAAWPVIVSGWLGLAMCFLANDYLNTKEPTFCHKVAAKKYIKYRIGFLYGFFLNWQLKIFTGDIKKSQDSALHHILKLNATSEYSKKWKLNKVTNREELINAHPLSKYQQFESYIARTAAGEQNVIVTETPFHFGTTSGTTGKSNLIPNVPTQFGFFKKYACLILYNLAGKVPGVAKLKRSMKIYYNPKRALGTTPSGITAGPVSACTSFCEFDDVFTSPKIVFDIEHESSCRYVHVLFGLRFRELSKIEAVFVPNIFYAFEEMEKEWRSLVDDIRYGTLRADLDVTREIRIQLEEVMKPDPVRADELESQFKKGFQNIARRIWPNLTLIASIRSGPFKHYADLLREKYTSDVLIFDPPYAATEGIVGVNMWPELADPVYLLWPWTTFFEFIPVEYMDEDQPGTVFMDQVEFGKEYEVVMTTAAGLTRYRLGDVIKIVDFYGQIPIIEFQYRSGHLLNIKGEKISELIFAAALKEAAGRAKYIERVVDYAICTNITLPFSARMTGDDPHYVILCELKTIGKFDDEAVSDFGNMVEEELQRSHARYRFYREKKALAPLRVISVASGGFSRLREYVLDNSTAAPSQIKIPKVLVKLLMIDFIYGQSFADGE